MSGRLGLARRYISSPSDAWLLARMTSWALVLPVLKYTLPLPRLVRFVAATGTGRRRAQLEKKITNLSRVLYRASPLVRDNCLERSLVAYRFLGRANARPELVVAMGEERVGHVWVTLDGQPVHDQPASVAKLVPMIVFGADGQRRQAP
jgi:hypothetical protein